jgi:CubicO group peptidase (beta-lactamase class C family)
MSSIRTLSCLALAGALSLLGPAAGARADDVAFPPGEPGRHAREYFLAFNDGEAAMKSYWSSHASKQALEQRPVADRVEVWRSMRAEFGRLTPRSVREAGDDFVEVLAATELGGAITVRFLCETDAAHGLIALRVEDADQESGPPSAAGPPPAATGPPPSDDEIVAALSSEVDSLAEAGAFSGTVLLDKGGRAIYAKAVGFADREARTPNQLDTRFNLGSINKLFTQTAITQLSQSGKLKLDDTIDRYLPDYPKESARKITIRMLLDHRSGVPDVLTSAKLWDDPSGVRTLAGWYAAIRNMPLDFEPGTKNAYSNGGFVLLGAIIAKVSREDYYDYIRRHIYQPAEMTRSDHYASDEPVEGIARGYTRHRDERPGGHEERAESQRKGGLFEASRFGRGSPAGGGYSTVGDLLKFANALRAGKLFNLTRAEGMLRGAPSFGIAGGSPGVNALFQLDGEYTLVVLANLDPPAAERFSRTAGRMVRRAGNPAKGDVRIVRPGGN